MTRNLVEITMVEMRRQGKNCSCGCGKPLATKSKVARLTASTFSNGKNMLWSCYCKGETLQGANKDTIANNTKPHRIVITGVDLRNSNYFTAVGFKLVRKGVLIRDCLNKRSTGKTLKHSMDVLTGVNYYVTIDNKCYKMDSIDTYDKLVSNVNIRHNEAERSYR